MTRSHLIICFQVFYLKQHALPLRLSNYFVLNANLCSRMCECVFFVRCDISELLGHEMYDKVYSFAISCHSNPLSDNTRSLQIVIFRGNVTSTFVNFTSFFNLQSFNCANMNKQLKKSSIVEPRKLSRR